MSTSADRDFIVASLGYRIGDYHKRSNVQIGTGNVYAGILVVQPHPKMPERDAITGALKNFGMLSDSYRATSTMIEFGTTTSKQICGYWNRYYLRELIHIIKPLVVVACGPEAMSLLRDKQVRSFASHAGKKFLTEDLTDAVFYATLNPADYGFARAPVELKDQGRKEWTKLSKIYQQLKEKKERARWE